MGSALSKHRGSLATRIFKRGNKDDEEPIVPDPLSKGDRLDIPKRIYLCPVCPLEFWSYGEYYGHVWQVHPGKFECGNCDHEFDGNEIAETTTCGFDPRFEWIECPKCKQFFGSLDMLRIMSGYFYSMLPTYLYPKRR